MAACVKSQNAPPLFFFFLSPLCLFQCWSESPDFWSGDLAVTASDDRGSGEIAPTGPKEPHISGGWKVRSVRQKHWSVESNNAAVLKETWQCWTVYFLWTSWLCNGESNIFFYFSLQIIRFFSSFFFSSRRMEVGLGVGMFAELQLAIQGLRQHERIHSRFNDLASLGEGDREHALDLYWICQLTPPVTGCLWTSPVWRKEEQLSCFVSQPLILYW